LVGAVEDQQVHFGEDAVARSPQRPLPKINRGSLKEDYIAHFSG
jgi:hypothetical protein